MPSRKPKRMPDGNDWAVISFSGEKLTVCCFTSTYKEAEEVAKESAKNMPGVKFGVFGSIGFWTWEPTMVHTPGVNQERDYGDD